MSGQDQRQSIQERITDRLGAQGWFREAAAEKFDWPDFAFDNGRARMEFFYSAADDWVRLGILTDSQEGYLQVRFGEHLEALLDAVIAVQQELAPDCWDAFIEILLAVPLEVYAITGEDESDLVKLHSSGSFRAMG
ncbi:hypothetical protein [Nonomuraea montanisoli]|uniref:hypothetical protein n=1 Tax=Nonomuraea montanisoli TaxID=2741721 RepID=UPI00158D05C8|nr:hypothetical protein [Nonomuraea montanisoli]